VAEEKETVFVDIRLGNIKIAADKWYQERIKQIIQELVEDLGPLSRIRL
jgi:hypothetical protein